MRSLRASIVAGFLGVGSLVVGGLATTVYARARSIAHGAMEGDLRFRADALSGLLEVEKDGLDFEVPREMLRDFQAGGRGAYLRILAPDGRTVVRSPSLEGEDLPDPGPWTPGGVAFSEIDDGPHGIPCAAVALSFVARAPAPKPKDGKPPAWTPPPEEARRYRVQVALDRRGRDAALASLARFLWAAGTGALLLVGAGALVVVRSALRPLRRMTAEAASLAPEDATRRLDPGTVVLELHELASTLNAALDRLGEALARHKQFTSDASHELRTPISILAANAEHLLRNPRTGEEYREGLRRQLRIAGRMKHLTENLLVLARADAGAEVPERRPVRLDEVADGAVREFADLAGDGGVGLALGRCDPAVVEGDPVHLRQLLDNLVSNAVKYTPAGGRVTVSVESAGEEVVLDVSDSGPGIPAAEQDRVFRRFYRVAGGRGGVEGAGLGLAIVAWVAEAHGARLELRSEPGRGSSFRALFPVGKAAGAAPPDSPRSARAPGGGGGGPAAHPPATTWIRRSVPPPASPVSRIG